MPTRQARPPVSRTLESTLRPSFVANTKLHFEIRRRQFSHRRRNLPERDVGRESPLKGAEPGSAREKIPKAGQFYSFVQSGVR